MIEIPYKVVDKILEWNTDHEKRGNLNLDRKICQSLVMSLVSKDDVRESKISGHAKEFIKACLTVRCGVEDDERIAAIDTYISDLFAAKATSI